MSIFSKNKIKLKKEKAIYKSGDNNNACDIKYFVNYLRIDETIPFKKDFFKELIQDDTCLVVINTEIIYKGKDQISEGVLNELEEVFTNSGITYKVISAKRATNIAIMGIKINMSDKAKHKEFVIEFLVKKNNFESIKFIINKYNASYYFDQDETKVEKVFDEFRDIYEDEEELASKFSHNAFDNTLIKQILVNSKKEQEKSIDEALDTLMSRY
jgi:uncharacterized protein (UPF0335 family)